MPFILGGSATDQGETAGLLVEKEEAEKHGDPDHTVLAHFR